MNRNDKLRFFNFYTENNFKDYFSVLCFKKFISVLRIFSLLIFFTRYHKYSQVFIVFNALYETTILIKLSSPPS